MAAQARTCQWERPGALVRPVMRGRAPREERSRRLLYWDPAAGKHGFLVHPRSPVFRLPRSSPEIWEQLWVPAGPASPGALQRKAPGDTGAVPGRKREGDRPDPRTGAVQVQRVSKCPAELKVYKLQLMCLV